MIAELIDKRDTFEIVLEQVGAILLAETAAQQQLAIAAEKDPTLWALRIFLERSNPWGDFIEGDIVAEGEESPAINATPIVNVSLDSLNFDPATSNSVSRQKASATFNIDCYAIGVSESDGASGHTPGDERAALEVQRAVKLVRNILMAAEYIHLGMQGTVWKRGVQSVTMFQPQLDGRAVEQIVAARISLQVDFNELSPQVLGEPLELISATVKRRGDTGEIYFTAGYGA